MQKEKTRLDEILVKRCLANDLKHAASLVISGSVLVNEQKITKPGNRFKEDITIRILNKIPDFVSRGAHKLNYALKHFNVNPENKVCLDLGASTGGFTEALLKQGAARVYAIDVGYGQLAERIRRNERVVVKDRFNVKNLSWDSLGETFPELLIVMDLSFISLLSIYPVLINLKTENPTSSIMILSLIKPQFECGENETVKGIVKDPRVHFRVLKKIGSYIRRHVNGKLYGFCNSPIKGASGNKEFFVFWEAV